MHIETLQFGRIDFEQSAIIDFPEGLLGFSHLKRYLHVQPEDRDAVEFLLPIDEPKLSFPLMNPHLHDADYDFKLGARARIVLCVDESSEILAYVVVSFGTTVEESTMNLLAPVLINSNARRGHQVVLEDSGYAVAKRLQLTGSKVEQSLHRRLSGARINYGADDATSLAIADGLRAQVRSLDQDTRSANDGVGLIQIADGALAEVTNLLTRAVTLAEELANGTTNTTQRTAIQSEFDAITAEIDLTGTDTTFNSRTVFSGSQRHIFVGDTSGSSSIDFTMQTLSSTAIVDGDGGSSTNVGALSMATQAGAEAARSVLNKAVANVVHQRAVLAATSSRLSAAVVVIAAQSHNTQAAESQLRDADIATAMA